MLVVTHRALDVIDTVRLRADGSPEPAQPHAANTPHPFGFDFAGSHLEVTNGGSVTTPPDTADPSQFQGSVSSYDVADALTATGNVASGGRAACWITVTKPLRIRDKHPVDTVADITTGKGAISRLSVSSDGTLTLLGQTDTGPGFPSDVALSSDSQYLYVLAPTLTGDDTSHIDAYCVVAHGSRTHIQSTAAGQAGA